MFTSVRILMFIPDFHILVFKILSKQYLICFFEWKMKENYFWMNNINQVIPSKKFVSMLQLLSETKHPTQLQIIAKQLYIQYGLVSYGIGVSFLKLIASQFWFNFKHAGKTSSSSFLINIIIGKHLEQIKQKIEWMILYLYILLIVRWSQ